MPLSRETYWYLQVRPGFGRPRMFLRGRWLGGDCATASYFRRSDSCPVRRHGSPIGRDPRDRSGTGQKDHRSRPHLAAIEALPAGAGAYRLGRPRPDGKRRLPQRGQSLLGRHLDLPAGQVAHRLRAERVRPHPGRGGVGHRRGRARQDLPGGRHLRFPLRFCRHLGRTGAGPQIFHTRRSPGLSSTAIDACPPGRPGRDRAVFPGRPGEQT